MKKSELSFKCVLPTPQHAKLILDKIKATGIYNDKIVQRKIKESGKTAAFMSICTRMGFVFGLSSVASIFCNWTEPLMSYEDALKRIESVEPDVPGFDIKMRDEVLVRHFGYLFWQLADFATYRKHFIVKGGNIYATLIKYEGNEHFHGTTDMPDGWWECENGKPVWRTKWTNN